MNLEESKKWSLVTTGTFPGANFREGGTVCFSVGSGKSTPAFTVTMNSNHVVAGFFDGSLAPYASQVTISGTGVITLQPTNLNGILTAMSSDLSPATLTFAVPLAGDSTAGLCAESISSNGPSQVYLNATNTYVGGTYLGCSSNSFNEIWNFGNAGSFGNSNIYLLNCIGGSLVAEGTSAITITNQVVNYLGTQQYLNIAGVPAANGGVTFSGPWQMSGGGGGTGAPGYTTTAPLAAYGPVAIGSDGAVNNLVTISGVISGTNDFSKYGAATLALSAVNTLSGGLSISNGTLLLTSTGSINNVANLTIYSNGTFDVSAIPSYNLSSSTMLSAAGAGATQGTTAAAINGASGGVVNLGSQPINLFYTPASSNGDAAHPALEVLQGALTLNNNQIEVSNTTALPMGIGTYTVIQVTDGVSGIINGTPNTNIIVIGGGQGPGSGLAAGTVATASVVNSTVVLTVAAAAPANATTVTTVTSPTTYGSAITATVSPVPNGGVVQFFANGAPLGSPVAVDTGTGVAASPALAAATYASFTAAYSGSPDGSFLASSTTPETLVVDTATVTVTANAQSTPYGTLLSSANGSGSTLFTSSGWQYNDTNATVTLTTSPYTTNTAAGSYNIVPSAAAGGSFNAANYTITYVNGTLTVAPVALTITPTAQSKTYGATLAFGSGTTSSEFSVSPTSFPNGPTAASMTLTLTSSGGVSNAPVSGSPYTIIPSAAVAASGATNFNPANYTITYNTNSLTVNPLPVILTGTQVYNSTTNAYASTLSVSNKVSGDDVSVTNGPGGMASADIGTNTITSLGSLALAGSTSGNYSLAGASGSVIVTPLEVTLIGTRPYDGTNDASSSILTVVTNYDGANLTLASGNAVLASANVGVQPIVSVGTLALGGSADGNYTLTGATLGTVTITNPYNVISNTASLDMSGTNFVVCWASVPGVTYTVLTNSSLNPPVTWTSAGTTTATDTNTCFTLPGGIMSNTNVNVVIQQ